MILLVVGAGPFFGMVLATTGIGTAVDDSLAAAGLPLILYAYVIACVLRIVKGSATVAIVTTGDILSLGHDDLAVGLTHHQPDEGCHSGDETVNRKGSQCLRSKVTVEKSDGEQCEDEGRDAPREHLALDTGAERAEEVR